LQATITKGFVNRALRYAAELGLIYLNNPKAGCSTIKFSLWAAVDDRTGTKTFGGNVHSRKAGPFPRDLFALDPDDLRKFSGASMFSVVRNPFSRILAAYLDKIPNDPFVWAGFHEGFGLRPKLGKDEFAFGDFLRLIEVAPPELLDGHFRPQTDNLLEPYAKPDRIFHLEEMRSAEQFLAGFGVALQTHVPHATQSVDRLPEFFDSECIGLVRKIYARDFKFGYSTDIGNANLPGFGPSDPERRDCNMDAVRRWIVAGDAPAHVAPDLPDLRAFVRTQGRNEKHEIVRTALLRDSNWARLARYARFARRRLQENALADAILEKMTLLRTRYEEAVGTPDIFLPMPGLSRLG